MTQLVPVFLWLWIPYILWLFKRLSAPLAVVVGVIGGWLTLPTAWFADEVARSEFPYWIMPACLPSLWTTKARIIPLACLLGMTLFDLKRLQTLRMAYCDYLIIGWCVCPFVSGVANHLYITESIANAAYQSLAWGVPYLLGRLYFASPGGMALLAQGIVVGGLVYAPLCLVESATGPGLYAAVYGFHPFQNDGSKRSLGFRPIVFLEHGNQLGIWLATSAMTAAWLWWSGQMPRLWRLPGGMVVVVLVGVTVLSQSVGAIFLLLAALVVLEATRRLDRAWPLVAALVLVLVFVGIRAVNLVDAKAVAQQTGVGRALIDGMFRAKKRSFGWRLRVEERQTRIALQRPWFGWGRPDWWRPEPERPWGLFSLVLGMYGLLGLALLLSCLALPLVRFMGQGPPRLWATPSRAPPAALAALLTINVLDAILNSTLLLLVLLAAGGLVGMGSPFAWASSPAEASGSIRYKVRKGRETGAAG